MPTHNADTSDANKWRLLQASTLLAQFEADTGRAGTLEEIKAWVIRRREQRNG